MMTASPRSLARRAEPHYRTTSDGCDDRPVTLTQNIAYSRSAPFPLWFSPMARQRQKSSLKVIAERRALNRLDAL
jgi:hypothetical protein